MTTVGQVAAIIVLAALVGAVVAVTVWLWRVLL